MANTTTPAFHVKGKPVYHVYKGGEPASYWYRLTPDQNGHSGRDEDLTGAFDVRSLSARNPAPSFADFMNKNRDVVTDDNEYRAAFMLWVQETCESDFKSIKKVTIK